MRGLADGCQALARGGPHEYVGEFFEQDRTAAQLGCRVVPDGLQELMRCTAPQQRGDHDIGIKNDPHGSLSCARGVRRGRP